MSLIEIQTAETYEHRVREQIQNRTVDTAQYFGEEAAAAWDTCAKNGKISSIPSLLLDHDKAVSVIDIGPGTGQPLLDISRKWEVREAVLIDVSRHILSQAMDVVGKKYAVRGIIGDLIQDTEAIRPHTEMNPKVMLCIGNLAANFRQAIILPVLRSLLTENDRLVIGVRMDQGEEHAQNLADFFASPANCVFGTAFLRACGAEGTMEHNHGTFRDDPEEKGVRIIEAFHTFPKDTTLMVGAKSVHMPSNTVLRFLRSGQFDVAGMPALLGKYGLEVIAQQEAATQAFFLCKTK